jgi:hypothetical protein
MRLVIVLPVIVAAGIGGVSSARAAGSPTPANPARSQYIPVLPSSSGSAPGSSASGHQYIEIVPSGGGKSSDGRSSTLPPRTQRKIDRIAGKQAPLLTKVATSSDYGAPLQQGSAPTSRSTQAADARSAVDAAVSAVATGDLRHIIGLGVAMALITVIFLAAAATRYRRREAVTSELGTHRHS